MKQKKIFALFFLCLLLFLSACTKKEENSTSSSYDLSGKTFYNTQDQYGHNDHSKLWLGKDTSFVLTDSYSEGYKDYSGKWSISENVLTLVCDNNDKILFEIKDNDTLTLKSSLSGSKSDDSFSTTEIKGSSVVNNSTDNNTNTGTDNGNTDNNNTVTKDIPCTKITSLYHNYWSYEGTKNWDLEIRPVPEDTTDKMSFKSNDTSVVTIDEKGRATAVGLGKTTIDVTCGDQKLTVGYEVKEKVPEGPEGAGTAQTFKAKIVDVADSFQPSIFFDSGFFTFTENTYSGMGQYKGIYDKKDNYIYCSVTDAKTMEGYAGADVKEIVFKIVDDKTIKLKTQLCMSSNGDLFYLVP